MAAEEWFGWKDIVVPLATALGAALVGFAGGRFSDKSRERSDDAKRTMDMETAHLGFDQAQMNTLTDRFKALLDGYERRITDLVAEVSELRVKHKELEKTLNDQVNFCSSCENYKRRIGMRIINAPDAAT